MSDFIVETREEVCPVTGRLFHVEISHDCCSMPPHEDCDGHGVVEQLDFSPSDEGAVEDYLEYRFEPDSPSMLEQRARFALMERLTNNGHRYYNEHFYDVWESLKKARAEGWGPGEAWERAHPDATDEERTMAAVMADMDYLRGWYQDEWFYAIITVVPYDDESEELREECESLGGVEFSYDGTRDEYVRETIIELMATCRSRHPPPDTQPASSCVNLT